MRREREERERERERERWSLGQINSKPSFRLMLSTSNAATLESPFENQSLGLYVFTCMLQKGIPRTIAWIIY